MSAEPLEIELVGGPHDGRLMAVSGQVEVLRIPTVPANPLVVSWAAEAPPFQALAYHRCVISEQTKRWRYVFGSHHTTCNTWLVTL